MGVGLLIHYEKRLFAVYSLVFDGVLLDLVDEELLATSFETFTCEVSLCLLVPLQSIF